MQLQLQCEDLNAQLQSKTASLSEVVQVGPCIDSCCCWSAEVCFVFALSALALLDWAARLNACQQ